MRRSAIHFGIPVVCALLGVTLIGASGKADEHEPHAQLAMAVAPAVPPAPAPVAARPTTRPAIDTLLTAAPLNVQPSLPKPAAPAPAAGPRVMIMEVTAYCPCKKCCGPKAQGITASGRRVSYNGGLFVAADKKVFDFHTKLKIPGYANGQAVPVLDRGGAIKGDKLDVFFPSHEQARKWGRQKIAVTVVDR